MKKLIIVAAILAMAIPAFGGWAIETGDGEVSSINDVTAAYTETVVTQRITYGALVQEIATLQAEQASLVVRDQEIQARINYIQNTALPWIEANAPELAEETAEP